MTSFRRIAAAALLSAFAALPAAGKPLEALSVQDVALYRAAFGAAERGDRIGAEQDLSQVTDRCLAGRVQYLELTRSPSADYAALVTWLKTFGDLPGARDVYHLAMKTRPSDAPPAPVISESADVRLRMSSAAESKAARDSFYGGDLRRALGIAERDGDAWIAGMASWRLGDMANALASFVALANDGQASDEARAAAGVWAARVAASLGQDDRAAPLLKIAARSNGFYGMVARRRLELDDDPLGALIDAADHGRAAPAEAGDTPTIDRLASSDPRAHRAVALMQLARNVEAGDELRAGLAQAPDDRVRAEWMSLMYSLGPDRRTDEIELSSVLPSADGSAAYPTPALDPPGGFTVDKALVYAVVWQESRFSSQAVSRVGAVGLMQLMPRSAASVAADAGVSAGPGSLFDAGKNLALGQSYISWLEDNAADHDLLRTLAAYNAGPATLARTEALIGASVDSLTVIESLPYAETRAYVKRVMAAYWTYRREFGAPTRTLDAIASNAPRIDARLDPPLLTPASAPSPSSLQNVQAASAPSSDPLEVLLHRGG